MKILLAGLLMVSVLGLIPRRLAPAFEAPAVLPDLSFTTISLSDYAGKYLVLAFYPFDFTYVCPTELIGYSNKIEEFRSNYQIYIELGA